MYTNCSKLPIFNFFELLKTKDLSLLLEEGEKIKDFDDKELLDVMFNIMTEYNSITENKKLMQEYKQTLDIEFLEVKYNLSKELISLYNNDNQIDFLIALKEFDWKINLNDPIKPQLDRIIKSLVGLKNKINIRKINFVKKFKREHNNNTTNFDLDQAVVNLEVGIPLSYKIDIHKDSIKKYVYLVKSLENKNKALENNGKVKSRR